MQTKILLPVLFALKSRSSTGEGVAGEEIPFWMSWIIAPGEVTIMIYLSQCRCFEIVCICRSRRVTKPNILS